MNHFGDSDGITTAPDWGCFVYGTWEPLLGLLTCNQQEHSNLILNFRKCGYDRMIMGFPSMAITSALKVWNFPHKMEKGKKLKKKKLTFIINAEILELFSSY